MKTERPAFLPHNPVSVRTAIWSVVVGMGLVAPLVLVLASLPLPRITDSDAAQQHRYLDNAKYPGSLFLKAVIIFPLMEEVFYRGIILQLLRRHAPDWLSVLFSAAFFGVTHLGQGLATGLTAFLLGCFFAWLVMRSHSLYPSILCHSAFNFSWLFLTIPYFGLTEKMSQPQAGSALKPIEIFPSWWIFASLGLVGVGFLMLSRQMSKVESATTVIDAIQRNTPPTEK